MPLPGSEKYRIAPVQKPLTWEQNIIKKANTEIRIEDVLSRYYGINVPYEAVSWKVRCPYAYEHEDGGLDKQFRIYSDSNNGYCFAMHGRVDNIRLYREINHGGSFVESAKSLMDDFDVDYRRKTYQEIFEEIREEKSSIADSTDVVEAMKLYLSGIKGYDIVQFDPKVISSLGSFLSSVNDVCNNASTLEEVEQWYKAEKDRIRASLLSVIG